MTTPSFSFQRGAVYQNGHPLLLITTDYPYYRDDKANWVDRLRRLKSLGIGVISAYIPWRHHQLTPDMAPDFTGTTQPNRDVIGFLALCQELDLAVIAKPGPFIHAELNYGGLPDWTCPQLNPRVEPLLNSDGKPVKWSGARLDASGKKVEDWPLPAPFDPEFSRLCIEWLSRVGDQVIRPNEPGAGPIVAIQIANEGIYSNGQHAPWAYDYSTSSIKLYHQMLQERYGNIAHYNQRFGTAFQDIADIQPPTGWQTPVAPHEVQTYVDWGEFQAEYMRWVFDLWSNPLKTTLPIIINQNPPLGDPFGLDAWLTRAEPERWPNVLYGYTNWVGDISASESAFNRYQLLAKRASGYNLEENWGFADLYDAAYVDAATCLYQSLTILNAGATGFNVYTGVATAHADPNMEVIQKNPYPDAAPITERGEFTPKSEIVRWLLKFSACYGEEFVMSTPQQSAAWGIYLPSARVGVWHWQQGNTHGQNLAEFQRQMRALHLDYGIVNLETASIQDLLKYPYLHIHSDAFMHRAVQEKLVVYIQGGGNLALVGVLPSLDENYHACSILAEYAKQIALSSTVSLSPWLANVPRPHLLSGDADIWVRSHPTRDVHFVTLLVPPKNTGKIRGVIPVGAQQWQFELVAARAGSALLRIESDRLTAVILKGVNHYLDSAVKPSIRLGDQLIKGPGPGDLAWIDGQTEFMSVDAPKLRP